MNLLDVGRSVVERAAQGDDIEVYVSHSKTFQVRVFEGEVESSSSAEPRGAGVRVIRDQRVGFAFTTDLSEAGLDRVVAAAAENSRSAGVDETVGLADGWTRRPPDVPGIYDPRALDATPEEKVGFVKELDAATRSADPRIRTVEDSVYADSTSEAAIVTSAGVEGSYRSSDAWCYSVAIATEGDDTQVGFDFDLAQSIYGLNAADTAQRSARRAVGVLGARKIPSARMPVVLNPYTAGQFLGVIAGALTGEAVQKGRSLFAGHLGDAVAASGITLWDDGRIDGAPGSSPWDAEGVATGRTEVITAGVLSSFLYDVTSARREGVRSTGNATRAGFKSAPGPAPSNLAFDPTGESVDEIWAKAGRAFLVQDFHGVHSGANAISGDFSVGATGYLIDSGNVVQPVKEVTIAAPMMEILKGIVAVGDDRRWLPFGGSLGGATLLVNEMTVAGS